MFTLIELAGPSYNTYSVTLSVISDIIFIGALTWERWKPGRKTDASS